ncbi:MAG: Ig-like domain-containing protein [Gammaproteobacteria bacterium]
MDAPNFVSKQPDGGAMDVALASAIQVTFDEAVEAAVADFWSGLQRWPVGFSVGGSGTAVVTLTRT